MKPIMLTSKQCAERIGVTNGTLRNWRTENEGPPWHTLKPKRKRNGKGSRPRIYYKAGEVVAWLCKNSHK
jgi:hypothetical protein